MNKSYIVFLAILLTAAGCKKNTIEGNSIVIIKDSLNTGWTKTIIDSNVLLNDIFFSNNTEGFCVGKDVIYKTTDGGKTWNKCATLNGSIANISVTNNNKIFAIGRNVIFKSVDHGNTFQGSSLSGYYTDVVFIDENNGFCVGTPLSISKTNDGGVNWQRILPLNGITAIPSCNYTSATFFSTDSGIITQGENMYISINNLNNWSKCNLPGISVGSALSICQPSSKTIYLGSAIDRKILQSTDGGITFVLKTILPKDFSVGPYLDLHFIDDKNGYASYGRRIFKTTDGGLNWQIVVELAHTYFMEIHFTDSNHGWGCTDKGEVLRYSF